jgi:DNA repair exonuclease SbcCD nuclease subunit
MRLVTFSDGHVGEYLEGYSDPSTGLNTRLTDTLNVWSWVHQLAVEKKADCVVFGGDRFKPKRPPAWMRDLADARLVPFRDSGLPLAMLKGNHDMWDKGARWTTYGGITTWRRDRDPLWVFDKPGALDLDGVCLYFLPYGSLGSDIDFTDLNPDGTNILIAHDDVAGMSNYGAFISKVGLDRREIDREEFLAVLIGHVHLRQELNFKHTTAFHIGSPLERVEDGDQGPKGALVIDIEGNNVSIEFVESPMPKVVRATYEWAGDIEDCVSAVERAEGNIVLLTVTHSGIVPSGLRRDILKRLRTRGVGSADVKLQAVFEHEDAEGVDVTILGQMPLSDECVEWARKTTKDDKLVGYLEQVIRRAS